ncbi:MAG: alcohol dehydrogenase catalytic domain-containing protein [Acidobacteriia bacterium]|nr:alcohol dehydrogenase catalytic domain-containing protein [Terriglobia bacterium]
MNKTMQALVFHAEGQWAVEEMPTPRIEADDEVLLKVDRASICGTDLHILSKPPGHPATPGSILGHEYVATVMDAGPVNRHLAQGGRVVIDPNLTCGLCRYCRLGLTNSCENMTTLGIFRHGGLAEYNVAPLRALHKIDAQVPAERATLAEPLSCVLHAHEQAAMMPGENVLILGGGPIGLLFLMLFQSAGAGKVIVVEPVEFRRRHAESGGATAVLDPTCQDVKAEVLALTGIGADIVVDAAGSLFPEAVSMVRRGGRVILFGMNLHAERPVNQYWITRNQITIIGSFIQQTSFPKVVRLLESGRLPLEKLVTHRLPLSAIGEGLEAMRAGKAIKVVVQP